MYPDITRDTFRPERHYSGLISHQGRVQLDADFNEQADIDRYRRRQLGAGTIGPAGVEKASNAFLVEVAPDGSDLLLRPGRMWVEGRLLENTNTAVPAEITGLQTVTVPTVILDGRSLKAGDWLEVHTGSSTLGPVRVQAVNEQTGQVTTATALAGAATGPGADVRRLPSLRSQPYARSTPAPQTLSGGAYAIVVEAWDREVTPIDDPAMAEVALNGTETATRLQSAWRARVIRIGSGTSADCSTTVPDFPPPRPDGRLAALVDTPSAGNDPCLLPDPGGYRGLEHQLYRVEVHRVMGDDVVLKWQRDNATLASRVDAIGTTFRVEDIGRDVVSGFQETGFVELTDEALELDGRSGDLLKVATIDRATREITIDTSFSGLHAEVAVNLTQQAFRPRARRWDGRIVASRTDPTARHELERGLHVRIEGSAFSEGDYWLVPARTATIAGPSRIEWPRGDDGTPLAVARHGVDRVHAKLAVVNRDSSGWTPTSEIDCRARFPHLTDIDASDVAVDPAACGFVGVSTVQEAIDELCARSAGTCTRTAVPGPGWESVFSGLPGDGSAEVCFPVGVFAADAPVEVVGRGGHLLVHGAGWGARIEALEANSVLVFRDFASVTIRDLSVRAGARTEDGRPGPAEGLLGALSFHACGDVSVERVQVRTAPRQQRETSAISIYGTSNEANRGHVAHCALEVGDKQVGVLCVDLTRVLVDNNVLTVVGASRTINSVTDLAATEVKAIERLLARDLRRGHSAARRIGVTIDGAEHSFAAMPEAIPFWEEALGRRRQFTSMAEFKKFEARMKRGIISRRVDSSAGRDLNAFLDNRIARRRVPVMSQGIVVGGRAIGDVLVRDNHVDAVIRGIHVGASHEAPRSEIDQAARIEVTGNRVAVTVPAEGARGRHGIFCGNARSIAIRSNELTFQSLAPEEPIESTGIRVQGFVDRVMTIRENFVDGFETSIWVFPLMPKGPGQLTRTRLYQVRENALVQSGAGIRVEGPLQSKVTIANNAGG